MSELEPMLLTLVLLDPMGTFLEGQIMYTKSISTLLVAIVFLSINPAFASKGAANQRKRVGNTKVVRSVSKSAKSQASVKESMAKQMKMNPKMKME